MKYALKRILTLLVTMLLVSFLTYAAFEVISGDPAEAILGTEATPERLAALEIRPMEMQDFRAKLRALQNGEQAE